MSMDNFTFNGNWGYKVNLPEFAGFQERNGSYSSISSDNPNLGELKIEFEDDLSDNTDPYPEQLNSLNYIFSNQKDIVNAIIEKTLQTLPEIIECYDLQEEDEFQNLDHEKTKTLMGFDTITIKIVSKDGFSYFDISGGCNWDEEHGLNILFHKSRIVSFSDIDGNSYWEAVKDNGTFEKVRNQSREVAVPKKYFPNQKYNKLKPSQKYANESYEYSLISGGFNQQFIQGVENGEIDINGKYKSQNKTFLEAACWFKNNEIVEYLLSKKADIRYALHQCVGYNDNSTAMNLLLKNGADINNQYLDGNTIIFELVCSLQSVYSSNEFYKSRGEPEAIDKLNNLKVRIKELIKIGADPTIKNKAQFDCFDIMRNSSETSRNEVNNFIKNCISGK
jgi:hypothetical protein